MLMKTKWFPRIHNFKFAWGHSIEGTMDFTIFPICHYDEGLGAPSAVKTNPFHASFAETSESNCFPNSRVNSIFAKLMLSLTKGAIETDKIHALRYCYMPIFSAFDDMLAKDEGSGSEVQDVLQMTRETTDRQTYPLYDTAKMSQLFGSAGTLGANEPGLTTTQVIESVNFNLENFYDLMHYKTNAGKMKTVIGGLRWGTLTKNHSFATHNIHFRSKAKRMNPYTFFGVLVGTPNVGTHDQYLLAADTTPIDHVRVALQGRYDEWHQEFGFEEV